MSLYFPEDNEGSVHQIFPGVQIRTLPASEMMLSLVTMQPNSVVQPHSHPHEQVGLVVEGTAIFCIGGEEKVLGKGAMYRIPSGVRHEVKALEYGAVALDIFHPVRQDYL